MKMETYPDNTFNWVDLAVPDPEKAKVFYSELFGWKPVDTPAGEGMTYTMLMKEGEPVAALYQLDAEKSAMGVPAHWVNYISVPDVEATVDRVRAAGGTVMAEPFDVMTAGRMALVADPDGAHIALWEARDHIGATLVNETGALCWNELRTRDVEKVRPFYISVFNWTCKSTEETGSTYHSFSNHDRGAGGMMTIDSSWGDVPPHWIAYFAVDDCDVSTGRAEHLGAKVIVPPMDLGEMGRMAQIQDPQGAHLCLWQFKMPPESL